MSHTIDDSWDFMWLDAGDGGRRLYGVRWADGHEVLFKDMPVKQVEAYIKRAGIGMSPNVKRMTHTDN